jgi:uncharacterized protein (DUF1697 family)
MDNTFIALLRGINVGGKNMIPMADLKEALAGAGLMHVRTYIQSGNVVFESTQKNADKLVGLIEKTIRKRWKVDVPTAVFSKSEWSDILKSAPKTWGKDVSWKHNLIVLLKPYNMQEVIDAIGILKPDIETLVPGKGVLYQSMSLELYGRTTTGKLASSPVYKRMTIRNYNTSVKLASLLQ